MASSLPPVKGVAFSFETSLVSVADTDTFQDNPTLAAGDVIVIKDGVKDDNIDTLPTAVTNATRVLSVALSATEMNADRVTVLFHDAAGDQWQDQLVTIYTAAQTLDTTDGVADAIKAKTDNLPSDPADESQLEAAISAATSPLATAASIAALNNLSSAQAQAAATAALNAYDPPTKAEMDAGFAEVTGEVVVNASVAISTTEAELVASGRLAIRSYHSFAQSVVSSSTANLTTGGAALWLAIKSDPDDADSAALVLIEKTAGLTVLARTAYGTAAHGALTISGSAGAWSIAIVLDEVATGLLHAYATSGLFAELKAKVGNDTVPVWDGKAAISKGIVQAVTSDPGGGIPT